MTNRAGLALCLLLAACGTSEATIDRADLTTPDGLDTSVVPEVTVPDLVVELSTTDIDLELPHFEVATDEQSGPLCEAGEGCFLDPCQQNDDCLSGWCVEHMGEAVCTQGCIDECPPGWECRQVAGGVDVVYICVSRHANLCRPCGDGNDCKGVGGMEDVCVDYGEEGSFCGGECVEDEDCPWGFSCIEATTVGGVLTSQCVADAGVCPCTGKSAKLGLATPCEITNEAGTCSGQRVCTVDGLSDCDAGVPTEELCNGLDDDCDGDTDEGTCDDGNACTEDSCLGESGCEHVALDQGECLDGDACTIGDHCEAGICTGSLIDCDDDDPCTDDSCDGLGGCEFVNNEATCDDEDPCTVADRCAEGTCAGTPVSCDCMVDSDCVALDDGDVCNGTLYCNTDKLPHLCEVKANSVVECPAPEGPDAFCLAAACDPVSGACSIVPAHDGLACNDGEPCTVGESCQEGICTGGVSPNCNDGNPCTDDGCEPGVGCVNANNTAPCNDNDVCTTEDQCADGACVGGAALVCEDDNPCTDDDCAGEIGCVYTANNAACDDGNACTAGEACAAGQCGGGLMVDCDDDEVCTADSCDAAVGCVHTAIPGPCDDGDACTGPDSCQQGVCQSGPALLCDDGNPCTADSCTDEGCKHAFDDEADCDDGNECTLGDHCSTGQCVSGGNVNCNDDNPCTNDSCDPGQGCVYTFNKAPCNDGDVCTLVDACQLGECLGSGSLVCNDSNPCTDDGCDPGVGCQFVPNTAGCDDGNECTSDDSCSGGTCVGGPALVCEDENPCTTDVCDAQQGCLHFNNSDPCDNGDACTENDLCSAGSCQAGTPVVCDDGNVCTDNECDPDQGCIYPLNLAPCDDGSVCTVDDQCANGECQPGSALSCDDGDDCTTDGCDPESGCVFEAITPCCGNGVPEDGEECDDGNDNDDDSCKNDCTQNSVFTNGMGGTYFTVSNTKKTNAKLACESHWGPGNCCNDGCGSCNDKGYHKCGTPNCNGSTYWNYYSTSQSLSCGWVNPNEVLVSYDNKNWVQ